MATYVLENVDLFLEIKTIRVEVQITKDGSPWYNGSFHVDIIKDAQELAKRIGNRCKQIATIDAFMDDIFIQVETILEGKSIDA